MVRTAIPGGKLTSDQLLAELDLCDEVGNTTLRITTRQGLQLHGMLKSDLQQTIRRINEIAAHHAGRLRRRRAQCHVLALSVQGRPGLRPDADTGRPPRRTSAAPHQRPITKSGSPIRRPAKRSLAGGGSDGHTIEPIYGPTYLPRKFKTGIGLPGDNSVDIYTQDLGLLAVCEDWQIVGYNVLVGGGFGVTPSAKKTFPAIAQPMAFVSPTQVIDVAEAIVKVQRDFGNRADRKVARLKYLIHNWGSTASSKRSKSTMAADLPAPRADDVQAFNDGMGWHEQGDGRWFYGLNVENGRIKDEDLYRLKSALARSAQTLQPDIPSDAASEHHLLRSRRSRPRANRKNSARAWRATDRRNLHRPPLVDGLPGLPTCGLAITESERVLPGMIDQLEIELAQAGSRRRGIHHPHDRLPQRLCPALQLRHRFGRQDGRQVHESSSAAGSSGDRLNFIYKDKVPTAEVVPTLVSVFRFFKAGPASGRELWRFLPSPGGRPALESMRPVKKRFPAAKKSAPLRTRG